MYTDLLTRLKRFAWNRWPLTRYNFLHRRAPRRYMLPAFQDKKCYQHIMTHDDDECYPCIMTTKCIRSRASSQYKWKLFIPTCYTAVKHSHWTMHSTFVYYVWQQILECKHCYVKFKIKQNTQIALRVTINQQNHHTKNFRNIRRKTAQSIQKRPLTSFSTCKRNRVLWWISKSRQYTLILFFRNEVMDTGVWSDHFLEKYVR